MNTYKRLLNTLRNQGFSFLSFSDFVSVPLDRAIVLRHDVDKLPGNSLRFARIQAKEGIRGSYYFRLVPESYDERIIKEISSLGHEIGYHYETMVACKGDVDQAYNLFCVNLEKLRKIVPVSTICMHGSPLSKYDNRLIFQKYDYRKLGLIGEPYFDVDFSKILYLTDTGRCWDGDAYSVRDKSINRKDHKEDTKFAKEILPLSPSPNHPLSQSFHSTSDIIKAAQNNQLPDKIIMTFHPQRWTDKPGPWVRELVWQNLKNVVKYFIVRQ